MEPGLLQREINPSIRMLLETAMKGYADKNRSEGLLQQAFAIDPTVLDTYVVFYKFYFYHRLLSKAEEWVHLALEKSAAQGGFDSQWQNLTVQSAEWDDAEGPERIFLYSLKALCFLRMKQGDFETPVAVFEQLRKLDPLDQVGWSVVLQMLERVNDDDV
ncbi:MAG: hypothetical protein R3240_12890 [Gammaproteobacteria bacterium]|nr:hypothetical protein [Gammaproteobacteria bacterium]